MFQPSCFSSSTQALMQDLDPTPKRRNVLEEFKNRLSQSSDSWKERVQTDPELKKLGAASRARRKLFQEKCKAVSTVENIGGSTPKGLLTRAQTSSSSISPPSKMVHLSRADAIEFDTTFPHFQAPEAQAKSGEAVSEPTSSALGAVTRVTSANKENEASLDLGADTTPSDQADVADAKGPIFTRGELEQPSTSDKAEKPKPRKSSLVSFFEQKCKEVAKKVPVSLPRTGSFSKSKKSLEFKALLERTLEAKKSKESVEESAEDEAVEAVDMDAAVTAPKLVGPTKAAARGRNRSEAAQKIHFTPASEPVAAELPRDYSIKQSEDSEDDGSGIASSARKGLQSKIDYLTEVQLKKREVSSGYPNIMLIRIKGSKRPDVRLVAPRYTSLCNYGVYVLILPNKIFCYTGKFANLREKTRATIMMKSITTKKGELGCMAKTSENVNETKDSEFWDLLGCTGAADIVDNEERNAIFECDEPFENFIARTNLVFSVGDDYSIKRVLVGTAPKSEILEPSANLIFDFGSEIYVWSGRSADRGAFQQAVVYAKQLQEQPAPHIPDSDVLFGDDFSERRPEWCILYKISQGLADSLFRDKFVDWKQKDGEILQIRKPKPEKTAELVTESYEESLAAKLAKTLASYIPTETKLILEETELDREAGNIYTDDKHFYLVQGETELKELNQLTVLDRMQCYIVKWDYRVEREDVHRLDGSTEDNDRDTGRQRVCYFFWLGSGTTNKEQGVCALALRNFDRERQHHERVVQGQEPFMFLAQFEGSLITVGYETRVFLVRSSHLRRECYLEELPEPIVLRSHAAYVFAKDRITVWYGKQSTEKERSCAKSMAESLLQQDHEYFQCIDRNAGIIEIEQDKGDCYGLTSITAKDWKHPPRLIRLVENEGSELNCVQWDPEATFSFRQDELRDTMIVDQSSGIWLWTDAIVTTQHLRVASMYFKERSGFATVICKTKEPEAFKALFPMWDDFVDPEVSDDDPDKQSPERSDPIEVEELLKQRNKKFPLEKVRARDLPKGYDLKRLEQYLTDEDFERVFKMKRGSFYALPQWKQINLRKSNDLF